MENDKLPTDDAGFTHAVHLGQTTGVIGAIRGDVGVQNQGIDARIELAVQNPELRLLEQEIWSLWKLYNNEDLIDFRSRLSALEFIKCQKERKPMNHSRQIHHLLVFKLESYAHKLAGKVVLKPYPYLMQMALPKAMDKAAILFPFATFHDGNTFYVTIPQLYDWYGWR